MLKWLKRWWIYTMKDNYIYVVTDIENEDTLNSVCFYNIKDATEYATSIERITNRTVYINYSELL